MRDCPTRVSAKPATNPSRACYVSVGNGTDTGSRPGLFQCTPGASVKTPVPAWKRVKSPGATKTHIVVAVVRVVVVAVRAARILSRVVPRAAPHVYRPRPERTPRSQEHARAGDTYSHGKHGRSNSASLDGCIPNQYGLGRTISAIV